MSCRFFHGIFSSDNRSYTGILAIMEAKVDNMPIEADAVIVGAGPVGLFQVFELGLLEIEVM